MKKGISIFVALVLVLLLTVAVAAPALASYAGCHNGETCYYGGKYWIGTYYERVFNAETYEYFYRPIGCC